MKQFDRLISGTCFVSCVGGGGGRGGAEGDVVFCCGRCCSAQTVDFSADNSRESICLDEHVGDMS